MICREICTFCRPKPQTKDPTPIVMSSCPRRTNLKIALRVNFSPFCPKSKSVTSICFRIPLNSFLWRDSQTQSRQSTKLLLNRKGQRQMLRIIKKANSFAKITKGVQMTSHCLWADPLKLIWLVIY